MKNPIEDLKWRYATKKFDATRKLSSEDFDALKQSLALVPTSYGLQPYKVVIVENPQVREELVDASHGQRQVADASHLFVLCAYNSLQQDHVDQYMNRIATIRNVELESLDGFSNMIKRTSLSWPMEEQQIWAQKQTYIALGQLLHTCANLRIDATPMEGFKTDEVSEILGLEALNLYPTLLIPVGYRHLDDANQHRKKVRKSESELFIIK